MSRPCRHMAWNYPQGECDGACLRDWPHERGQQSDERRAHDSLVVAAICMAGVAAIAVAGVLAALLAYVWRLLGLA